MLKKILIITDAYPPKQNPRAFRIAAIVDSLLKRHYKIDILMPKCGENRVSGYSNLRYYETSLVFNIDRLIQKNSNFSNLKHPNIKNIYFRKIVYFLVNLFLWPDIYGLWFWPAKKKIKEIIKGNKYDCVISFSPSFVNNLLAGYVKKELGDINWISVYGDPFSFSPQKSYNIFRFLNKTVESITLKKTDYIVVMVEQCRQGFLKNFNFLNPDKIKVIPQSFLKVEASPVGVDWSYFGDEFINIVYTGSLYSDIRSPEILLESLLSLKISHKKEYNKLRFHFFGDYGSVANIFNKYKELLDDKIVILYGKVLRNNCAFACQRANFLLNISNKSKYQIPSKLIEYLLYKKPTISLDEKYNELKWPLLVSVGYEKNTVTKFLKEICQNKITFSDEGYKNFLDRYGIDNITDEYIRIL